MLLNVGHIVRSMMGSAAAAVVEEPTQKPRKPCNCTKSRCLKLYAVRLLSHVLTHCCHMCLACVNGLLWICVTRAS